MNIYLLLSAVIYGLSIGGIFFLVSIGLSIGFGLMRVVNLEQMLYYTFSAYITYTMVKLTGQFWLGLLFGIFIASMLGLIVETLLLRRVYGKEMIFTMIVTFSVFLIGIGIIQIIWGLDPKPVASPIKKILNLFGLKIPLYRLIIIVVAIATYLTVKMFLQRTIIGKAIRAGIENPDNLQGLGINIYRIFTITFVIASALAGLGYAIICIYYCYFRWIRKCKGNINIGTDSRTSNFRRRNNLVTSFFCSTIYSNVFSYFNKTHWFIWYKGYNVIYLNIQSKYNNNMYIDKYMYNKY